MLGRFSSALQNAVDVLAPPPPLHEDFAYHWKRLMKNYLDVTTNKNIPIELTNIPARLEELLKILIKEDDQTWESGRPGPCLEYLLQHNLLDLLATLATSDEPAGLKHYVLQFVTKFLSGLKTQVVGHQSVFLPLHRLVALCDGTTPGPSETQEVQFLLGLAAVVRRNPQLVPVFTANNNSCATSPRSKRRSSCGSSETSCISSSCPSDISTTGSPAPQNNPLFLPLVTSVRSKSIRLIPPPVSPESCVNESLSSSSDDNKSIVVDDSAQFPLLDAALSYIQSPDSSVRVKACQIVMLLVSLPDVRAAEIIVSDTLFPSKMTSRLHDLFRDVLDSTDPSLVDDLHVSWGLDTASSSDCSSAIASTRQLFSFLAWFDFYDQVMAEAHPAIGQALARDLKDRFLDDIFDPDALRQPSNVAILSKCFKMSNSQLMTRALGEWLVGQDCEKDSLGSRLDKIYHRLLVNWSSCHDEIILETVGLFEAILDKGDPHVIQCLLLNYVDDGSFLDLELNDADASTEEMNDSLTRIERIIKSFVNIVPVGVRSSECIGYEQYIAESQRQYKVVSTSSKNIMPSGFTPFKTTVQSSRRDLFYEGPFLRTLFNSLANVPNQSYEVNLELTGIVSKVCLRPEPLLSKYMLETTVEKMVPEANTLHSVLHRVANELASRVMNIPDYETRLKATRLRLISDQIQDFELPHLNQKDFENMVVVEELCKELAAIAFVKHKQRVSEL